MNASEPSSSTDLTHQALAGRAKSPHQHDRTLTTEWSLWVGRSGVTHRYPLADGFTDVLTVPTPN